MCLYCLCIENCYRSFSANTTASLNYSLQCETPANAPETPRSRSSFVLMPCVESGWVGPSPHPMGATSSHRTFGALPSNSHPSADKRKSKSSKFVLDDNANTLPGGSHSEQESDTARQKNEEIRNEEKPTIVRKRRRCTRVCYPGKRKRKMKVDGPELSSKLHGNNCKCLSFMFPHDFVVSPFFSKFVYFCHKL